MIHSKSSLEQRAEDDHALIIANSIVFLLKRAFFTVPPLGVLWLGTDLAWWPRLISALLIGYALQFLLRRALREEE